MKSVLKIQEKGKKKRVLGKAETVSMEEYQDLEVNPKAETDSSVDSNRSHAGF